MQEFLVKQDIEFADRFYRADYQDSSHDALQRYGQATRAEHNMYVLSHLALQRNLPRFLGLVDREALHTFATPQERHALKKMRKALAEASSEAHASTEEALWHRSGQRGGEHSLIDMDKSLLGKNPFAWLGSFFENMAAGLKQIFEWVGKAIVAAVKFIVSLFKCFGKFTAMAISGFAKRFPPAAVSPCCGLGVTFGVQVAAPMGKNPLETLLTGGSSLEVRLVVSFVVGLIAGSPEVSGSSRVGLGFGGNVACSGNGCSVSFSVGLTASVLWGTGTMPACLSIPYLGPFKCMRGAGIAMSLMCYKWEPQNGDTCSRDECRSQNQINQNEIDQDEAEADEIKDEEESTWERKDGDPCLNNFFHSGNVRQGVSADGETEPTTADFDDEAYQAWREQAFRVCHERNSDVMLVSVKKNGDYRCFSKRGCDTNRRRTDLSNEWRTWGDTFTWAAQYIGTGNCRTDIDWMSPGQTVYDWRRRGDTEYRRRWEGAGRRRDRRRGKDDYCRGITNPFGETNYRRRRDSYWDPDKDGTPFLVQKPFSGLQGETYAHGSWEFRVRAGTASDECEKLLDGAAYFSINTQGHIQCYAQIPEGDRRRRRRRRGEWQKPCATDNAANVWSYTVGNGDRYCEGGDYICRRRYSIRRRGLHGDCPSA